MRAWTALGVAALTAGLAFGSDQLIRLDEPFYGPFVMYFWLFAATAALAGLLWLYVQIAVGPRATVSNRTARRLERALEKTRAGKGDRRKRRETMLRERAGALRDMIDPTVEANNVFRRRVRLANAVLALVCVLTASFLIFAELAPRVWPSEHWFIDAKGPDAYHAALFSVDQVLRGTLFDLFDVFDWNISSTHYDPHNQWFAAFIVIYRFLMSGALFAAIAVRLGMREDWHEKAARAAAEDMKARLASLAGAPTGPPKARP